MAIDRPRPLRKHQKRASALQTGRADLHGPDQIYVGIDGDDTADLSEKFRQPAFPIVTVAKNEYPVDHLPGQDRDQNRAVQKRLMVWTNKEWHGSRQLFQPGIAQLEKYSSQ